MTSIDLEPRSYRVTREDLMAYAAASGDQNPIHQDPDIARSVGLPGVIAHGMFTLALVGRYLEECGVPVDDVAELGGKFVKPVVVPAAGAEVTMLGALRGHHDQAGDRRTISVEVVCDGVKVFGPRGARVRLRD
ncbi:MAG: MaoC/PaaZ C-terminal domain-containing protein [Nocardioides sp.]